MKNPLLPRQDSLRFSLVALLASTMLVHPEPVFSTDFATIPPELDVEQGTVPYALRPFDFQGTGEDTEGSQQIDVTAFGATGQWLFTPNEGNYNATLSLTDLGPHSTLDIGFFFLAGGGLDGNFGGQNDSLEIKVDGETVFGPEGFGGRSPDRPGYQDSDAALQTALIRAEGVGGAPNSNLNNYRTGAWGHDALYDMSLDPSLQAIEHTASTATIEFITNRSEAPTDEYFGFANLVVETDTGGRGPFQITRIDYSRADNSVSLAWPSSEGQQFSVAYSFDLRNWDGELDANVVAEAGEETVRTYSLNDVVTDETMIFFRVQRQ
jgi:hypothetical protein